MELIRLTLILISLFSITVFSEVPRKLRQYKVCRDGRCTSLRSFPSPEYMNKLLFSFSGWSPWSTCSRNCSTHRSRICRFSFLCAATIVHEEAFCFHRGSRCEAIFHTMRRTFEAEVNHDDDYSESSDSDAAEDSGRIYNRHDRRLGLHSTETRNSEGHDENEDNFQRHTDSRSSRRLIDLVQNVCGVARNDNSNRRGITMRILGGRPTKRGRWPWQVAILNRHGETFCGGTLIASRWVLTAAHCVRRRIQVTIGEHHLQDVDGTEKEYLIQYAFIHPQFDPETVDNDIALLLLPEAVNTQAGVACLPIEYQSIPSSGTMCTILGWGKERYNHIFGTSTLQEGQVPIVSSSECRLTYDTSELTNNMFCGGYRNGSVDSCAGDSGGPLLCRQENRWTVFGVTSFGDGCGRVGKYGIYAKVPNYVGWIYKVITATEETL